MERENQGQHVKRASALPVGVFLLLTAVFLSMFLAVMFSPSYFQEDVKKYDKSHCKEIPRPC